MVRPDFVKRKIHLITEDLAKLVGFKDITYEDLLDDFVKLAAVERLIERIVTRAIDINAHFIAELATGREEKATRLTYHDTFLKLASLGICSNEFAKQIAKSAGLRNILIHDYNDTDRRVLYSSIGDCLKDYQSYTRHILAFLKKYQ